MLYRYIEGLGEALESAMADAVLAWRDEHAKGQQIDDLFASAISSVTCEATLWPQRRATVIINVRGRRQFDDETHVIRLTHHSGGGYRRAGSTLPST